MENINNNIREKILDVLGSKSGLNKLGNKLEENSVYINNEIGQIKKQKIWGIIYAIISCVITIYYIVSNIITTAKILPTDKIALRIIITVLFFIASLSSIYNLAKLNKRENIFKILSIFNQYK